MTSLKTETDTRSDSPDKPVPGLVLVWTPAGAACCPVKVGDGLVIGRDQVGDVPLEDGRLSREHCEVRYSSGHWHVRDLDSHNGTYVDKQRVTGEAWTRNYRVLRAGRCLFIPVDDAQPFYRGLSHISGSIVGPQQHLNWSLIADAAKFSDSLLIWSEPGAGEAAAARHFHGSGLRSEEPYTQIDCATLSSTNFEKSLGVPASQESPGTLVLGRAELLDRDIQQRVWRLIATRGGGVVVIAGAPMRTRAEYQELLDILLTAVRGPHVEILPLRERREEIPWHVQDALRSAPPGLGAHVSLIEECIMRDWPGNIPELAAAVAMAARRALSLRGSETVVHARDLNPWTGNDSPLPGIGDLRDGTKDEVLLELLLSLFSEEEMRQFIVYGLCGPRIGADLPSPPCSPAHLAHALICAVHRHGIKRDFFLRLGERFPMRTPEIESVASQWGVHI